MIQQENNPPENKAKETEKVENKVEADEEDGELSKDTVKEESKAETPQEKKETESETTKPDKPENK